MKLILAALLFAAPAYAGDIVGLASVVDGDSLTIGRTKIRLSEIDAPESWQRCTDAKGMDYACGRRAAEALDAFLAASRPAHCSKVSTDRYGRSVSVCTRNDGQDVGRWLVRNGWAIVYQRYSSGVYDADQEYAARKRVGIWQGFFTDPAVERARRK